MSTRLRICLTALILAVFMAAAACSNEANVNQPVTTSTNKGASTAPPASEVKSKGNALVHVVHAVPGGPAVDVFADDAKPFTNVAYKAATPYAEVSGERHAFRVRPAGKDADQPLAENSEGLADGRHYTVVAEAGADNKPAVYIYGDDLTLPAAGKARVRVIHASPYAGDVNVYVNGRYDKLFGGLNAMKASDYSNIDLVAGAVEVRPAGQDRAVLTVPNAKFEAGKTYTVVVTGRAKGAPKLEAVVVEDRLGGAAGTPAPANANRPAATPATTPAANRNTR